MMDMSRNLEVSLFKSPQRGSYYCSRFDPRNINLAWYVMYETFCFILRKNEPENHSNIINLYHLKS